jgi:hypothetical protein
MDLVWLIIQFHKELGDNVSKAIPVISINKITEEKIEHHYTNLQPLWASENISKGNKI